jgi:hypothetical protein
MSPKLLDVHPATAAGRSRLPGEAREGLMRAWLAILTERHPQHTWIAVKPELSQCRPSTS